MRQWCNRRGSLLPLPQLTWQQATGMYTVSSGPLLFVSADGWAWRRIAMP